MSNFKVINIFGGPGIGKSTTAADLFVQMKKAGYNVELVTEYAKDMTWENRMNVLKDQLYILAKQNRRLERLKGQVEWVITDSPVILGLVYTPEDYLKTFPSFIREVFDSYDNYNFVLTRDFGYQSIGRNQTEHEACQVDDTLNQMLNDMNIDRTKITSELSSDRVDQIMSHLGLNKE